VLLFLQLEIEIIKLLKAIISDFGLIIKKVLDMIYYFHVCNNGNWQYGILVSFLEFKPKDEIFKNKSWE
jgi:hypothetical protein